MGLLRAFCFICILLAAAAQNFQSDPASLALNSVQRLLANDELKCLPRLLCEQLAGGTPGQLRGLQVDTQSFFILLKYLGLEGNRSPMLGMGEAILTGLSKKGDPYSCYTKYPNCPRDQFRLLHYLNNHRGGFFRGFSNPYYGKSESRIVNKNLLYLQQLEGAPNFVKDQQESIRPQDNLIFSNPRPFQDEFTFSNRRPKNFNFQPAAPTDRLPAKFQFPQRVDEHNFFTNKGASFFPQ